MSFRDHLFPHSTPLFPTAAQVQDYLVSYAKKFSLRPYIRFETTVERLYRDGEEWVIESSARTGLERKEGRVDRFDKVVVANGHYEEVHVPVIPGIS
jgi:cation diffusion facilitator CzcD-associated flavoprotein CzcO